MIATSARATVRRSLLRGVTAALLTVLTVNVVSEPPLELHVHTGDHAEERPDTDTE